MRTSWWVWPAIAGVLVGGAFLVRAAISMLAGLSDEARASVGSLLKRRVRVISVAGVVATWTLVYALYSMTLPANIQQAEAQQPRTVALGEQPAPSGSPAVVSGTTTFPNAGPSTTTTTDDGPQTLPPIDTGELPPIDSGPGQKPCSVKQESDLVRALQGQVEQVLGRPVGADFSVLVDAVAGCSDAASAALALLGPVNEVLQQIGILPDTIDLPNTPVLQYPTVPEPIAAPLRPYVFEVCSQVSAELVTVSAVSIFLHLNYDDVTALFRNVDAICGAFAPA